VQDRRQAEAPDQREPRIVLPLIDEDDPGLLILLVSNGGPVFGARYLGMENDP